MEIEAKIGSLCQALKLPHIAEEFHGIAATAAKENWQYIQFLHELLQLEYERKMDRSIKTLTKFAS